jgi:methylmalonyl-CoA carboxyltransferase large subunit
MTVMQDKIEELRRRQAENELGGGADKQDKQRQAGRMTARERVAELVDEGSFDEVGQFAAHRSSLFGMQGKTLAADGVVTGAASVNGRLVHLASQDFTVVGGSAGEMHSIKVADIMKPRCAPVRPLCLSTTRVVPGCRKALPRFRGTARCSTPTCCCRARCRKSR